jgi:16S rRNA (guanine966-N2)-methyltransferase
MDKLRIQSGDLKSRVIKFKTFGISGFRPTTSLVRKTLFNWLPLDLHNMRVLDLFAGSGILGFEAKSRGAEVDFVDNNAMIIRNIKQNAKDLHVDVVVHLSDAISFLLREKGSYDIILLDPPYQGNHLQKSLNIISSSTILNSCGLVYVEFSKHNEPNVSDYKIYKRRDRYFLLER